MSKTIHFFDLDRTLWSVDTKLWLIDKNNPSKPLIRLSSEESTYIIAGVYKNDENMITYDGKSYWISDDMLDFVQKKRKTLEIEHLGISSIERTNPDYFDKVKIYIENIRHIIGKEDCDFGIISARYSVDNDNELLLALKEQLKELGISITKFYYTGDFNKDRNTNKDNIDKMKVLLEHMVGFHIEDNHFAPIKQNFYENIHFYDDEYQNINIINGIQEFMEEYLKNSVDIVYNRIVQRIEVDKPKIHTHLITNNQLKRFKTETIELVKPVKYSIKVQETKSLKSFDDFKNKL